MSWLGKRAAQEEDFDPSEAWNDLDLEIASTPFRTSSFAGYGFRPAVPDNLLSIQPKNSIERASFCILPSSSNPNEFLIKYKLVPDEVPFDLAQLYTRLKSKPPETAAAQPDQKSTSNHAENSQRDSQLERASKRADEKPKIESYRFDKTVRQPDKMLTRAKRKPAETGRKAQELQSRRGIALAKPVLPFKPIASRPLPLPRLLPQPKPPTPDPTPVSSSRESPEKLPPASKTQDCLQDPTARFVPSLLMSDVKTERYEQANSGMATSSVFNKNQLEPGSKPSAQSGEESLKLFQYWPAQVRRREEQEFIDSELLDSLWDEDPVLCQVYMFKDMSIHRFDPDVFNELHKALARFPNPELRSFRQSVAAFQATRRAPQPKRLLLQFERFASFDKVLTSLFLDIPVSLRHLEALNESERAMLVGLANAKFGLLRKGGGLGESDSDLKLMIEINNALKDLLAEIYATFDGARQTEAIYREFVGFLKYSKGVSMVLTLQQHLEDESVFLVKAIYEEHHRRLVRAQIELFGGDFAEFCRADARGCEHPPPPAEPAADEVLARKYGLSLTELQFMRQLFSPQTYAAVSSPGLLGDLEEVYLPREWSEAHFRSLMKSQSFRDQFVLYLAYSRPPIEDEFDRLMQRLWGEEGPEAGLEYLKARAEATGEEPAGAPLFSTFNEVTLGRRHLIEKAVKHSLRT